MLTLSIDPATGGNALAIWEGGRLMDARWVAPRKATAHKTLDSVEPVVALCSALKFAEVVIEKPQVYSTGLHKGDQNDLITLGIVVGALTASLAPYADKITHVRAWSWKGQVTKKVTAARCRKRLDAGELQAIELPKNAKHRTDVWDAVGIGLWRWREVTR